MTALKQTLLCALALLVLGGVFALYAHPDFVAMAGDVMWSCMGAGHGGSGHAHH
ncbi:MAG: hypothetical protein Q4G39_02510 [Brachymonas sp.]|nr:hypothetical protein [Brachymonas sp.]